MAPSAEQPGPSRREAYLAGVLLVVASAVPLALRSDAWVELFARGPARVDLGSRFAGSVHREGEELVVVGGRGAYAVARTPFPGRAGTDYLLRLRRSDSPALVISLIGPDWRRIDGPYQRPAGSGVERVVLRPEELSAGAQLSLAFRPPGELRITGLEVRELAPAYRWVPPLLRGIAPLLLAVFCFRHRRWLVDRSRSAAPAAPLDRRLLAVALFLVCLLVFYAAPVEQVFDSKYLSVVSHSLLAHGTTAIPDGVLEVNPARTYRLERVKGRTVHFFSHAPAVLNAPFVWIYGLAGVRPVEAGGTMMDGNEVEIFRLAAAVVAAGLCLVLYGIGRRWLAAGPSLGLVAVFAFGTQIFSTISRPYWSHAWASLLLAAAVYLLVAPESRDRPGAYVAIASLLSWAFFCRPTLALSVVAVTLVVALGRRSFLPYLVLPGVVWLGLFMLHSRAVFDTLLPRYFFSSHVYYGRFAFDSGVHGYAGALAGTLVSPSRGLFVFVPFFAFVLWGVARHWRRLPERPLAVAALSVIAAHWLLVSSFGNWWGGSAYGPRLFADVVVWFFVLAALALAAAPGTVPAAAVGPRRLGQLAVLLAVGVSLFIHFRGATAPQTIRWPAEPAAGRDHAERQAWFQNKLWDWRDPQFLAGLLERAPRAESPRP